jgi:hypothetical protein
MTSIFLHNQTILQDYFTKSNFTNFKVWYKSIDLFIDIYNELDNLSSIIENSKWSEDTLRLDTFEKIKLLLINQIKKIVKKEPEEIYNEWIKSIQPYCFQGGKGYKIQYTGDIPNHWCVKPDYYNIVSNIPKDVSLCAIICNKYITISSKCEIEYWNN